MLSVCYEPLFSIVSGFSNERNYTAFDNIRIILCEIHLPTYSQSIIDESDTIAGDVIDISCLTSYMASSDMQKSLRRNGDSSNGCDFSPNSSMNLSNDAQVELLWISEKQCHAGVVSKLGEENMCVILYVIYVPEMRSINKNCEQLDYLPKKRLSSVSRSW